MWKLFDDNLVALVTGGSRGIGRDVAKELAKNGVTVIVNFASNGTMAARVCQEIEAFGGKAVPIKANIKNMAEVDAMFKEIRNKFGRLDILVNNAGIIDDGFIVQMSSKKFMSVIETNLFGCYYVTKNALLLMASKSQKGGNIVNISSTSGIAGQEGQGNYSASKGGIIAFSKAIAKEYAGKGIRCNVVAPGFVDTDMTVKLPGAIKEKYMELIPLKRYGLPREIANTVLFLASSKSSYITGKVITVDGGLIND